VVLREYLLFYLKHDGIHIYKHHLSKESSQ
jgi:hypothetical protein